MLPSEFVNRMKDMMGEEELTAFLSSYECRRDGSEGVSLPRALRINPLKLGDISGGSWSLPVGTGQQEAGDRIETAIHALSDFGLAPVPWAKPYGFYYGVGNGLPGDTGVAASPDRNAGEMQTGREMRTASDVRPGKSPLHDAGLYYMQEPSAMATAALSGVQPGGKVLDLCAAPGGKSTMLASMLGGQGLLVSNEIEPDRARILSQNVERMGIVNAVVTNESPEHLAGRFPYYFDRVIVDAPCSGEGMFRKEEQAITTWSPEKVKACARLQAQILDSAAVMVKSGGLLVYSTCTFAPEEDEGQAVSFLSSHPEFDLVDVPGVLGEERMRAYGFETGRPEWAGDHAKAARTIRLWPHRLHGEGHFVAVFRKTGEHVMEPIPAGQGLDSITAGIGKAAKGGRKSSSRSAGAGAILSREEAAAVRDFLADNLTVDIAARCAQRCGADAVRFGDELYLMPYAAGIPGAGLKLLRPGLHLGTLRKGRFEPAHALAMALRPEEAARCVSVAAEGPEAAAFLRGESLPCDPFLKGWTLIAFDGISAGWAKASGGMLKNHYPKGLRRSY